VTGEERNKLEQAAGVSFPAVAGWCDDAELMVKLVQICDEARDDRMSDNLRKLLRLRRQAQALGAEVTAVKSATVSELQRHDDSFPHNVTDRKWPQHVLGVLVEAVAEIWHEHGGQGVGSYWDEYTSQHEGKLLNLLSALFEQANIPEGRRPSRHSLHNAISRAAEATHITG
jgi:hypothetical protein